MMWFRNAYDRASAAEYVLTVGLKRGLAEEYHPGYRRTSWQSASIGAVIMNHYPQRMVYDRALGSDVPAAHPFYRVHGAYLSTMGERVETLIEFDNNYAYLKRSSEYTNPRPTRPNETNIWDEAMAALDESLLAHAVRLGWVALPQVVELPPSEQFIFIEAA